MASADIHAPAVSSARIEPVTAEDEEPRLGTRGLIRLIWADPQHTAELLAAWSLALYGPRAESALDKLRSQAADADALEQLVVKRQAKVVTAEGAFAGGPFLLLIPVAFCVALLEQAQMVFELAGAHGLSPVDRLRAADLLVLQGAYPSTDVAMEALAAVPADPKSREGARFPAGQRIEAVKRMAYLLEILTPPVERSRLRATVGWIGVGVLVLVGFAIPLVWLPYMAWWMRRSTLRLAERAHDYYSSSTPAERVVASDSESRFAVGGIVAFTRTLLLAVLPVVVLVVALLSGFSFLGGRWLTDIVLLLAVSALATLAWLAYRGHRLRKRAAQ